MRDKTGDSIVVLALVVEVSVVRVVSSDSAGGDWNRCRLELGMWMVKRNVF